MCKSIYLHSELNFSDNKPKETEKLSSLNLLKFIVIFGSLFPSLKN